MSTQSGLSYKRDSATETTMSSTESGESNATGTDSMAELLRLLLEDRRARDEELAQERARRESAETRQS